jgi:O-succinylhomoserine sulfhydrylase
MEGLIRPETRLVYVETPSNPGLDIVDIAALSRVCRARGVLLVVDNCFATPAVQQPIRHGADLVIHSATKFLDGQGRVLGGVVVGRRDLIRPLYLFLRTTGPTMSAFNAWVLSRSLETLHVRMDRHAETAMYLAEALSGHPAIRSVRYPFLPSHPAVDIAMRQMRNGGGLVTFDLVGGREAGVRFLNRLQMLSMTNNLGDTRSIASHPASTTHAKLTEDERLAVGITPGLIRISAGLEHHDDILRDVLQALSE